MKKARCYNCVHSGTQFKLGKLTHLHCEHESYTQEDFDNVKFGVYDTLMVFNDACEKHEFKTNKIECDHYFPPFGRNGEVNRCVFCSKEKLILSCFSYFDKESYLLGQKANFEDRNPFEPLTNSWFNWNNGKNTNNN